MMFPRGIPSARMVSSPLMPVFTRSGSGVLTRSTSGISSLHFSIVVGPSSFGWSGQWVGLSALQRLQHRQASLSRGCDSQKLRQPFAARVGGENTHLRVARPVRHLRCEPCPNQELQPCIDLFEVIAQKVGELLVGEQGSSMPGKKDQ